MAVLLGELDDLILDRRAVPGSDAGDLARVQRRLMQVVADRLVRVPIFYQLTDEEQARVIAAVQEC